MSLKAEYRPYTLFFRFPAGTSRGIMHQRKTWIVRVRDEEQDGRAGYGEAAPLPGLSPDDRTDMEEILAMACSRIGHDNFSVEEIPSRFPSVRFALEMALKDLRQDGDYILFPSPFTKGRASIPINGLIWMGDPSWMKDQIRQKVEAGFRVIKIKVGALPLDEELAVLKDVRREYRSLDLEIRLDANGAFPAGKALEVLRRFSEYHIHSIEQPIAPGQYETMARLIEDSPIPVALDEELIGPWHGNEKKRLLEMLHPHYLILKPTLLGGFRETEEWIRLAGERGIGWWITSLLESNIGLNALAQWTFTLGNPLPQGLGTGMLYTQNFRSPLYLEGSALHFNPGFQGEPVLS